MNWWKDLKGKVRQGELLKRHTTFKIGGPAKLFIEPLDRDDLKSLLTLKKRYKIPLLLIGAGSNILVSSKVINAVVVRLSSPFFKKISFCGNILEAGSGTLLRDAILAAARRGLSGGEFLAGIPGTLGGALVMNAGMGNSDFSIGDLVESIEAMDYHGKVIRLTKKDIKFGYRCSNLTKYIILSVRLRLARRTKRQAMGKIKEYWLCRRLVQDLSSPNAGCIFKNPPGYSAGRLIDSCGLKGRKAGGARISLKHANFILNDHQADSADVLRLMQLVGKQVKAKFKVNLEPEIKVWS
ncbi:UDP-N-acetylmuramate dehydrogenase [bacterium]|nr:MAG: UDP-N-acetylmuramate dehydrogenase [bacterium]